MATPIASPSEAAVSNDPVIMIHENGLSPEALRRVMSPFNNARDFSGIEAAAAGLYDLDAELDAELTHFAKVAGSI